MNENPRVVLYSRVSTNDGKTQRFNPEKFGSTASVAAGN
jgi:hypothetical protein